MKEIRLNEINTSIHTDTRQQTLGGIKCPMTVSAAQAINDMGRGAYNYLQFKIELQEEQIHLVKAANIELPKLPTEIPDDHARYGVLNSAELHAYDPYHIVFFLLPMHVFQNRIQTQQIPHLFVQTYTWSRVFRKLRFYLFNARILVFG